MDTIPWVLLKVCPSRLDNKCGIVSVDTIPWVLLKVRTLRFLLRRHMFQWILFLGSYLKGEISPRASSPASFSGYYSLGLVFIINFSFQNVYGHDV